MTSPIGQCGRYELLRFIESGGMGEIFVARDTRPNGHTDLVALKRLLPHAAADEVLVGMFRDEAKLAMDLVHPNICRVFELGRDGDQYFLVMEWIDGISLQTFLRRSRAQGAVPYPLVARIIGAVADGLHYAHTLETITGQHYGVVHRDVSPPNIMLGYQGEVKLLDFGLAKARTQLYKTQPGYVKGKLGYLAPEQIAGRVDHRIDIFALGLCLYEALVGDQLFNQTTMGETIAAIRRLEEPPSVVALRPDMPAEIDAIMRRALQPNPDQRWQAASAIRDALAQVLESYGEVVTDQRLGAFVRHLFPEKKALRKPAVPPPEIQSDADWDPSADLDSLAELRPRSRKLWLLLLAALVVLALLIGILAGAGSQPGGEPDDSRPSDEAGRGSE